MARLSDLRLDVHTSYTVNPDGSEGEVVSQTVRYTNVPERKAYSSVEEALDDVNPEDLTGIEEGEVVEAAEEPAEEAEVVAEPDAE